MKIAIDMTWLKPKVTGGGGFYIRNILEGISLLPNDNQYLLFTAKDNTKSLQYLTKDNRFKIIECSTYANSIKQHLIWQSTKEWSVIKKYSPDILFNPVYEAPFFKFNKIKMITGILDIQAVHYPEYFSKAENFFFNLLWQRAIDNSDLITTISDFCVEDIKKHFKRVNKIKRIYVPIIVDKKNLPQITALEKKYNIKKGKYLYTVASLRKHKNLKTLVNMMIKYQNKFDYKLVISGVSGPDKKDFTNYVSENIPDKVILTDFVSDKERNALIKNCNCFLFSSVFEGFGMPPVEAMMLGSKVISTKSASLHEVTQDKCTYVDDPYNIDEWFTKINLIQNQNTQIQEFPEYDLKTIAKEYLDTFEQVYNNPLQ